MRDMTEADFDAVYDIYMDESVNPFMHLDLCDKDAFRPFFEEFLQRDYVWAFEEDGEICAFCSAIAGTDRTSHVAHLSSLAVRPDKHRQGIGKKAMESIIQKLKEDGFVRIELIAETDNEGGIEFYKSVGFQVDGTLPKYFKRAYEDGYVDDVLMSITD